MKYQYHCLLVTLFLGLSVTSSWGFSTYYWDANGPTPGAGANPNGTWDVDAFWSVRGAFGENEAQAIAGTQATVEWGLDPRAAHEAVFSAGSDANGSFTVQILKKVIVRNFRVQEGTVTIDGGILETEEDTTHAKLSFFGIASGAKAILNTQLLRINKESNIALIKLNRGTLVVNIPMIYIDPKPEPVPGQVIVEGGILQIGANQIFPENSPLFLRNGGNNEGSITLPRGSAPPTFHTGGFSHTFGPLMVEGENARIDFGEGSSALVFADSDLQAWDGEFLTLTNYTIGQDSLRIGTDNAGFEDQLQRIRFADIPIPGNYCPAIMDSQGFITPNLDAPVITVHPTNQEVIAGHTLTLAVVATGPEPRQYQWVRNGSPVFNGNSPTLVFENADYSQQGVYYVEVTNAAGTTRSRNASVLVKVPEAGAPRILSLSVEGGEIELRWEAVSRRLYEVYGRSSFSDPTADWQNWGTVQAESDEAHFRFNFLDYFEEIPSQYYYRLQLVPENR